MKNKIMAFGFLLSSSLFNATAIEAQVNGSTVVKGVAVGAALWLSGKNKKNKSGSNQQGINRPQTNDTSAVLNFNSKPADQFKSSGIDDLSGTWEGEESNGGLIMYYSICLTKIEGNSYSGVDYGIWKKYIDRRSIAANAPNAKKSFIGNFSNGVLNFIEISQLENSNWGLRNEKLKVVDDNGTPAIINANQTETQRKFYLKRTSQIFPQDYLKYVINSNTIQIENPVFKNSKNQPALKFGDQGQLLVTVKNNSEIDLSNVTGRVTTTEKDNGIINYDKLYDNFNLTKSSELNLPININTDFSVPRNDVHFTISFTYSGIPITEKTIDVPTESFYKTSEVTVPSYSSARLKAVSGYYGLANTTFTDVSKQLDPLVVSGDNMAAMWKAAFLYIGYGNYKIDEDEAYSIGKSAFPAVETKARNGDAEALYLMFYACQLGLEGDAGKMYGNDFLKKSAVAGFIPARYDYALVSAQQKDFTAALNELQQLYDNGVKKAASTIAIMYEKGQGTNQDLNTAMDWCKKGMAFGDPEASLVMADLYAKGLENVSPDPVKAMSLATEAASKGCGAAMVFVAEKYENGKEGVAANIPLALKWLKQGAAKGNRQAMLELGLLYSSDVPGMIKDENTGIFWIKKAAIAGSPTAMKFLVRDYHDGNGVEKNEVIARYWYNQAVLTGNAQQDNTAMEAVSQSFSDFWNNADFSPSYILVDSYGDQVGDSGDGFFNGILSGTFGAIRDFYGNQQQLIDGLEYICKRDGYKIYGGTVSSFFASNLYLKAGQTVDIKAYGTVYTGMASGMATADGLGNSWQEYAIVKGIPCSAVVAAVKGSNWQFIGQHASYTAQNAGPMALALNAIDYRSYKGYFDVVLKVGE